MKRLFTILMGGYLCFHASYSHAQFSSGLQAATSIISENGSGSVGWNNPLFALANDANRTSSTALLLGDDTEYLELTGFNINIPTGMIITGIEVQIIKNGSNGISYSVTDYDVRIIKGGVKTGNNMALAGKWPSSDQTFVYGSSTENWGTSWTPADINSSSFGVAISAHLGGLLLSTAKINGVAINVSYDNAPLPVTMIQFDAKLIRGNASLSWATATETNNYGFTVQRSVDGINWENIGEVLSHKVNSNVLQSYSYLDQTPYAGTNYYRLLQTDISKAAAYTAAVSVNNSAMDFSLYPNPANEVIHLSYAGKEKLLSITLSDLMGRAIQRYDIQEGNQQLAISTTDLLPGEYLISMASDEEVVYERVLIGH